MFWEKSYLETTERQKRAADMRQKSSHIIGNNTLRKKERKCVSNEKKYLYEHLYIFQSDSVLLYLRLDFSKSNHAASLENQSTLPCLAYLCRAMRHLGKS